MANALELHLVSKIYEVGGIELVALDHVDLTLASDEVVTLLGPSGSGKTTLLSIAGGLLSATSGRVVVGGEDVTRLSPRRLTRFRRERVGFIFQAVNLVPFLTARENLLVVAELARRKKSDAKARAERLLEELGLGRRMDNLPAQLSGGERQRVAIGRALMNAPELVLVDEPTSALDSDLGQQVMELIVSEVKARGAAAVVVTHDARITRFGDRILNMADGRIAAITPRPEWTTHRAPPEAGAEAAAVELAAPVALPRRCPATPAAQPLDPSPPPPEPRWRPAAPAPDVGWERRQAPPAAAELGQATPMPDLVAEPLSRSAEPVDDAGFWKEADDSGKFRRRNRRRRPEIEIGGFGADQPVGDIVAAEVSVPLDEDSPLSPPKGTPAVADGLPVLVPGLPRAGGPPSPPLTHPPVPEAVDPAHPPRSRAPGLPARRTRPPTPTTGTPAVPAWPADPPPRRPSTPATGAPAVPGWSDDSPSRRPSTPATGGSAVPGWSDDSPSRRPSTPATGGSAVPGWPADSPSRRPSTPATGAPAVPGWPDDPSDRRPPGTPAGPGWPDDPSGRRPPGTPAGPGWPDDPSGRRPPGTPAGPGWSDDAPSRRRTAPATGGSAVPGSPAGRSRPPASPTGAPGGSGWSGDPRARPPTPAPGTRAVPGWRKGPRRGDAPEPGRPGLVGPPFRPPTPPGGTPAVETPEQVAWRDLVDKGQVRPATGEIDMGRFRDPEATPPPGDRRPVPGWVDADGLPVLVPGMPPARRAPEHDPQDDVEDPLAEWRRPQPAPAEPAPMPMPGLPPRPSRGSLASPVGPPRDDDTDTALSIWPRPEPPPRPAPRPPVPEDDTAIWPTAWWGSEEEES